MSHILKANNFYSQYIFIILDDWKLIQDMKVPSGNIPINNLVSANIHLNNFGIFIRKASIKLLPLIFSLTNNGKNFLLSDASNALAGNNVKNVDLLLFSFGIVSTNGVRLIDSIGSIDCIVLADSNGFANYNISLTNNVGFKSSILEIIGLGVTDLEKD